MPARSGGSWASELNQQVVAAVGDMEQRNPTENDREENAATAD
jgi:hypothetical protein